MTYNQLFSTNLVQYFNRVKLDFIRLLKNDGSLWTAVFRGACNAIMKENKVSIKEIPIKESIVNNDNKAVLYAIEYEEIFSNRNGDAYCVCLTFDGDDFRLFTFDKVEKSGKSVIYLTEKFADGTTKLIKEHTSNNVYRLCLEVKDIINN